MIELRGIRVCVGSQGTPVLELERLAVGPGERLAVLGASGAGKSTLARLIVGLIEPTGGSMVLRAGARVGYVGQDPASQLVASSAARDVAFSLESEGADDARISRAVESALAECGLAEVALRNPHELSGGQQQRVALAGVLASGGDILVLDEPCSHLDPESRRQVRSALRRAAGDGRAMVLVSQLPGDIALATRVVVLERGRVVFDGGPDEFAEELLGDRSEGWGVEPPTALLLARELGLRGPGLPWTTDDLLVRAGGAVA